MIGKFTDVSSHNPDTYEYFKAMKDSGFSATVIKLSEGSEAGSNYRNPKRLKQRDNAVKAGLLVHFYHYFLGINENDARDEARLFVKVAKEMNVDPTQSVMVCDVEDNSLTKNKNDLTRYVNAFHDEVKKAGFPHIDTYTGSSWARDRLNIDDLITKNIWLASYGLYSYVKPNNYWSKYGAWQYSGGTAYYGPTYFAGAVTDANNDYTGFYTTRKVDQNKNGEYNENGCWYYYENGNKITGWKWVDPPGKTCYYDAEGRMVYGWQNIGGHRYYFDRVTGAMKRGFFMDSENDVLYHFNDDGWLSYGNFWVNENHYYAIETTGEVIRGLKFDKNGVISLNDE